MKNKRQDIINYLLNMSKNKHNSWFEKQQFKQVANLLKYKETCDSKYFYKARDIVEKLGGLQYRDTFISMFDDSEKALTIMVNDKGKTKVINYDDNFFYIESLLDTYLELIEDSFKYWVDRELDIEELKAIKQLLQDFYKNLKQYGEIDLELANKRVQELLK